MKLITKNTLASIERQIYNRARDIDVALFNAIIDKDCKDFVLDCLFLYVNNDGGFAHGLEIDNYNTNSTVYQVYEAFRLLAALGFDSSCDLTLYKEIINKACNYLFNRQKLDNGRWNPVDKTNNNFAHSEEYTYYDNVIEKWQFHPTAALVGYILQFVEPTKAYYKKAVRMIDSVIKYFKEKNELSLYDYTSYNALLGSLKKMNIYPEYQELIHEKLINSVEAELNKNSDFDIALYLSNCDLSSFEEQLDKCLDRRISSIAPHGLWEYTKDWGNDIYPEAESAKLKWLGAESINQLFILDKFGRIEK